jgi:hypothetical protein
VWTDRNLALNRDRSVDALSASLNVRKILTTKDTEGASRCHFHIQNITSPFVDCSLGSPSVCTLAFSAFSASEFIPSAAEGR